jgi:hypothetical protein
MSKQALLKEMEVENKIYDIFENALFFKKALKKIQEYLGLDLKKPLMLVNITYDNGIQGNIFYSGFEYIKTIRAEKGDKTPVIFYGFESLENLKKKPDASILNSPAVEYIKMPFLVNELSVIIQKVAAYDEIKEGLDKQTKKAIASDKVRVLKHDIINAVNTVKIAYKLKRSTSSEVQKENWESVKKSLFKAKNLISKNIQQFESIKNNLNNLLPDEAIINTKDKLTEAESRYKILINSLDEYSEKNKNSIISDAEKIIVLLNDVITILMTIKHE